MDHPMVSSGTLEFADEKDVYIIESAYQFIAIKHVTDDVDSRANFFNLLPQLNLEGNVSSFCRYHRSQELLKAEAGHVNLEIMRRISMDHVNGPGNSSICCHGVGMSSATLSSAIMELDGQNSKIHIALGTPCHAWASSEGHITVSMKMPLNAIPAEFQSGESFRQFCLLDPLCGEH